MAIAKVGMTSTVVRTLRRWVALIAVASWALAGSAHGAGTTFVPVGHGLQDVSRYMTMLEDPTGKHTVEEVVAGKAGEFREPRRLDGLSLNDSIFWGRLRVNLSDYKEAYSYFLMDPFPVGRVEIFYPVAGGGIGSTAIDENTPLAERELAVRSLLFRVPTPAAGEATLYLKFEKRGHPLHTRLSWTSQTGALEEAAASHLAQGVLFGFLVMLIFFNTFLFLTTRDRHYAIYVAYLICFTLLMSLLTGTKLGFVPGSWTLPGIVVLNCAVMHSGLWFARSFFELRKYTSRLNQILRGIQFTAVGLAVAGVCGLAKYAYPLSAALILPTVTCLLMAALIRSRQGFVPARFTTYGIVVHAAISTAYVLQLTNVIPGNFISVYWMEGAAAWEALFFSFALAYRVRLAEEAAQTLIAEQKKSLAAEHSALAEAKAANAEKNTFLSMISHELRSPLQSIVAALDVERGVDRGPTHKSFVRKIAWAAERIDSQLRDLFILSVGEAGKLEMRAEPFEVGELVEDVAAVVADTAKSKGLRIDIDSPPEPLFVVADPKRIEQVLSNLVENAVKYTPQGSVSIKYELLGDQLQLVVADSGVGISAEHQKGLFVPYRRFGTVERERNSSGIGLAVVKTLLAHLGGSITVASEVDVGTIFTVKIPVAITKEFDSRLEAGEGRHLLIVDDRQEVLDALCSIGTALGYDCDSADSAAVAGNFLASRVYDLVLIDLDMPLKNGSELASEIRRGRGPNSKTRLIAISAGTAEAGGLNGAASLWPFDGFVEKPIDKADLLQIVEAPGRATQEQA
jgi:signal transduction histidine kinase